ncbi:MAG: trypsin-like peptidase domain-containing protein [Litoricolaceae bacterium]|nr:trypsin-like peptidase domain-containing protein [Litorivicinaceae bacterium]
MKPLIAALSLLVAIDACSDHGPQTWERAHASVVSVLPTWPGYEKPGFGAPSGVAPEGSGVVIGLDAGDESRWILTAAHVVSIATDIVIKPSDRTSQPAKVVWLDQDTDIALLEVRDALPALTLASQSVLPGEHVCALGNPFGLGVSMSCGVISGPNRQRIGLNRIEDFIQTDAAINPGSSGGALVDAEGHLIGMIAAIFTKDADIDAGVNFAVSVDLLIDRMQQFHNR